MENKNFNNFINELSEDFERTWKHHPPVLELRGWWWKRYIPHYRKMRDVMQKLIEEEWGNNYERIDHLWKVVDREYGKSLYDKLKDL